MKTPTALQRAPNSDEANDPPPNKREYYLHLETGDRGYLVERDGKPAIKWDRAMARDTTHELHKWKKQIDEVPLFSLHQIAMVAFVADKEVCRALGQVDIAQRLWVDLTEKQRRDWMMDGPKAKTGPRRAVYKAILLAMGGNSAA
jgi:hypothetical protein